MRRFFGGLLFLLTLLNGLHAQTLSLARIASGQPIICEGTYAGHLQGICTDGGGAIFWSWTTQLVKTDSEGKVMASVPVVSHHGDLCYRDGQIYVAVNLGKFNEPAGQADSWVFVYNAGTLIEVARYPLPEVIHGAGGMSTDGRRFIVIGGLPPGADSDNHVYEYDLHFKFKQAYALKTGYTVKGIQTAEFAGGAWWFSTYDQPRRLYRTTTDFKINGQWEFDGSLGFCSLGQNRFLIGSNTTDKTERHRGQADLYRFVPASNQFQAGNPSPALIKP